MCLLSLQPPAETTWAFRYPKGQSGPAIGPIPPLPMRAESKSLPLQFHAGLTHNMAAGEPTFVAPPTPTSHIHDSCDPRAHDLHALLAILLRLILPGSDDHNHDYTQDTLVEEAFLRRS
jgi:hypothetical protein